MILLLLYVFIFIGAYLIWALSQRGVAKGGITGRKTVTFGDESAVRANRTASIVSVAVIFLIWGAFTGAFYSPVPGPFIGDLTFEYTAENAQGDVDDATVIVRVHEVGKSEATPELPQSSDPGFARDDAFTMGAWRKRLMKIEGNDIGGDDPAFKITAINGTAIQPNGSVDIGAGSVFMSAKGSLLVEPDKGYQMEPIWLPSPGAVISRVVEISTAGYQNNTLWENIFWSVFRVVGGFFFGALLGIPLGFAMGLNSWVRGWFDPFVEFMRPVPPLALIPLVIIWFGIGERAKIILLFLAALWIMTIAARAGVSGVAISKVHAAYSLGASRTQILLRVILPNALPEIFTGARVAMGVCWGTVVAAELVAAEKGVGQMIMVASKFQLTDIVIMGIIIVGIIGYGIDILLRFAEKRLIPWKGRV